MTAQPGAQIRPATVFGTAALAARYADDLIVGTVRDTHGAIARRAWTPVHYATRRAGKPPRVVHNGISTAVYGGISGGFRAAARVADTADRRGIGPPTEATRTGRLVTSTVHGLIGDRLIVETPEAATVMAVRVAGADVPLTPGGLAGAFPGAAADVVVFVHGLMEHDDHWRRRSDELPSYGDALAAAGAWTPVYLRVNTGLPIAANGVALASLLDRLVAGWPVPVRRIALVGHSMGGLIIRRACAVRTHVPDRWQHKVGAMVMLGCPHLGANLERLVHGGSRLLGVLPETRGFARILDTRSGGITDLFHGVPERLPTPPGARIALVSATLGPTPHHPVSIAVGDGLVRHPSALGRSRRGGDLFPGADTLHLPSSGHLTLLNHPEVHRKLQEWLG